MTELYILRFIHIVGGVFWVGTMTFMAFFLFPAIRASGPAGGQVMANLGKTKMMTITPVVAVLTMLSGLRLMMKVGATAPGWFSTPQGMWFSIGGGIAILTFFHGLFASRPIGMKMMEIGKQMAESGANTEALGAQMSALQAKGGLNLKITATMLLIATIAMSVARYM